MKNLVRILSIIFFLQSGSMLIAQDSPKKMMRKANTALSSYYMDPGQNAEKLKEAQELIDAVVEDPEYENNPKALIQKGEVYNAIASRFSMALQSGNAQAPPENPAIIAYDAFMKAYDNATKRYEKKDIEQGFMENAQYLSALGNAYIGIPDYAMAYESFKAILNMDELLKSDNSGSVFEDDENYYNQKYVVAVCAIQIGKHDEATDLLTELYEQDYPEPRVYSILFELVADSNPELAENVMDKGKKLFPGDINILFSEINYLIQNEEYQVLETKLQEAIKQDPDNPTVRSALGNVYMNLHQEAFDEGDEELAEDYFDKAVEYFDQALEIDDETFDAIYSIGMMYFNKAAAYTQAMQELGLSEQERYDELDALVKENFELALPYFKRAETLNPNDLNTLMGLREILARMNKLEDSQEIKARMDALQEGQTLDGSYFDTDSVEEED